MEEYIQISKLNDFIFCPRSVYLHSIYDNFNQKTYHSTYQTVGKIKHESIDKGKYSSSKRYLQGLEIFSDKYRLAGKIDIYDVETKILVERKYQVKNIYDGYRYQLYAQMICMREMGYEILGLAVHSLCDNKRFVIPIPNEDEVNKFNTLVGRMQNASVKDLHVTDNETKCQKCIYKPLCH